MIDNGTATETLREQVMIAQFQGATGCTKEQARQLLQSSRWEFETALSMFFQDIAIPPQPQSTMSTAAGATPTTPSALQHHCRSTGGGHLGPACAPCNTPATPPNFPEALLALQKLQAGGSGADWSMASPPYHQQQQQLHQQTPKVLASFNPMPPPSDRYFQSCDWPTTTTTTCSPPKRNQFASTSPANATPLVSTVAPSVDQHEYSSNPFYLNHRRFQYNQPPTLSENNSPMEGDDEMATPTMSSTAATFPIEAQQ